MGKASVMLAGRICVLTGLMSLLVCAPVMAAGDIKKGEAVFNEICADCHSAKEGKNRKGPSLFGVAGRQAGVVAGYSYSDALKKSGVVWTPNQLEAYLTKSTKLVPGTKMKVDISDLTATQRSDVIAYLATLR